MNKYVKIILIIIILSIFGYFEYSKIINNQDISIIAEDKANSVVLVVNNSKDIKNASASGLGTGFFIDENLIVTNHHVIENSNNLYIKGKNSPKFYDAEIIASDKFSDVALVRIKDWDDYKLTNSYKKLAFSSSRNIPLGMTVWSIGHPWGLTWTIAEGVISSPSRRIDGNLNYLIQTDTEIYQGNSGGPLLDTRGNVIGINTRMVVQTGGSFGFAIPSDLAVKIISDLKNTGKVTWAVIGVKLGVSDDQKQVVIKDVSKNSAGEKAGLQAGDAILGVHTQKTPANGVKVIDTDSILNEMAIITPGEPIRLNIIRGGKLISLVVVPDGKTSNDLSTTQVNQPAK